MALSPNNNDVFLQEVDDAVRRDRFDSIVNNYGRWILGGVLAALIAFAGYLYWGHRQEGARGEQGEELIAAIEKVKGNQPTAATAALKKLASEGDPAYRAIALVQQSNMKAQTGDVKGAVDLLKQVTSDTKLDQSLRDMALVRQTALEFDTLKPQAVIARLKPIVDAKDPQSSWFASAAELTAAAYYQSGQFDAAGKLYGRIAKLPGVSKSLQSRSVQMAGMLGVDAVTDRASASAKADTDKAATTAAGEKGTPGAAAAAKTEETK